MKSKFDRLDEFTTLVSQVRGSVGDLMMSTDGEERFCDVVQIGKALEEMGEMFRKEVYRLPVE